LPFERFYAELVELERDYRWEEIGGATATLQVLRGNGLAIGILTGDQRVSLLRRASKVGHRGYLDDDLIFCADDLPHPKPDGRAFQPILRRLEGRGIGKEEVVFVGDLLTDYATAKAAGVAFLAVTTGLQNAADFVAAGVPDGRILPSVADVPQKLGVLR
jgi:HAD superfamily hydrolase (TIGR01549 family)